jgi:DNA-binding MarR family transcriptional regulator
MPKRSSKRRATAPRRDAGLSLDELQNLEAYEGPLAHPGHYIRRLHQISVSVFLKEAEDYGLTQVQFAALVSIAAAPGIDQGTLCRRVALDRQNVSSVVQRLEEKGLIVRKAKDGRTNALHLLPGTAELVKRMQKRLEVVDEIILAPLNDAERTTFIGLLVKLVVANNGLSRAPHGSADRIESKPPKMRGRA